MEDTKILRKEVEAGDKDKVYYIREEMIPTETRTQTSKADDDKNVLNAKMRFKEIELSKLNLVDQLDVLRVEQSIIESFLDLETVEVEPVEESEEDAEE